MTYKLGHKCEYCGKKTVLGQRIKNMHKTCFYLVRSRTPEYKLRQKNYYKEYNKNPENKLKQALQLQRYWSKRVKELKAK